jgi:hypothetical protein
MQYFYLEAKIPGATAQTGDNTQSEARLRRKCYGCGSSNHLVAQFPTFQKNNTSNNQHLNSNLVVSYFQKPLQKVIQKEVTILYRFLILC